MNRKHAKALLLAMEHKTMAEIAKFLTPSGNQETRTAMIRNVAALESELQRRVLEPTPIESPICQARCKETLEMNL